MATYLVSICSPCPGTVRGGDGRLQLCPLPAGDQVQLRTLLQSVGGVSVQEAQTIATCPQLVLTLGAVPVLVTTVEVRIEALVAVRTAEVVSLTMSNGQHCQHQSTISTCQLMSVGAIIACSDLNSDNSLWTPGHTIGQYGSATVGSNMF